MAVGLASGVVGWFVECAAYQRLYLATNGTDVRPCGTTLNKTVTMRKQRADGDRPEADPGNGGEELRRS